jgi:hypothetical protein
MSTCRVSYFDSLTLIVCDEVAHSLHCLPTSQQVHELQLVQTEKHTTCLGPGGGSSVLVFYN